MEEIRARLCACWHVLRGRAVMHGVSVYGGEVSLLHPRRHGLVMGKDDKIEDCTVFTDGPVTFSGGGTFTGNSGNALTSQALARQARDEARVRDGGK